MTTTPPLQVRADGPHCRLEQVTVFCDRAELLRVVRVAAADGGARQQVLVTGLSAGLQPQSVRVAAKGRAAVLDVAVLPGPQPAAGGDQGRQDGHALLEAKALLRRVTAHQQQLRRDGPLLEALVSAAVTPTDAAAVWSDDPAAVLQSGRAALRTALVNHAEAERRSAAAVAGALLLIDATPRSSLQPIIHLLSSLSRHLYFLRPAPLLSFQLLYFYFSLPSLLSSKNSLRPISLPLTCLLRAGLTMRKQRHRLMSQLHYHRLPSRTALRPLRPPRLCSCRYFHHPEIATRSASYASATWWVRAAGAQHTMSGSRRSARTPSS